MSDFTFEHEGQTYRIPPGETAATKIPGRYMRDAIMGSENAEMRLGFAMLEHVDADPGALDAIYSMPTERMLEVIQAWMAHRASKEDASLGESSGSSA